MPKYVIINADDLGIWVPTNLAIRRAFREGVVTSASLMANMPAFEHAVEEVVARSPDLSVGAHLCLTSGKPVLDPLRVPLLVDGAGQFRHGFCGLWRLVHSRHRQAALQQITAEWQAQLDACRRLGCEPDHVDSHQHVHMIPELFEIAASLARRLCCPAIRVSAEPLCRTVHGRRIRPPELAVGLSKWSILAAYARTNRRRLRALNAADRAFGVVHSGRMALNRLLDIVESAKAGVTEIIMHPGLLDSEDQQPCCSRKDLQFLRSPDRQEEFLALTSARLRAALETADVRLSSYARLAAQACPTAVDAESAFSARRT